MQQYQDASGCHVSYICSTMRHSMVYGLHGFHCQFEFGGTAQACVHYAYTLSMLICSRYMSDLAVSKLTDPNAHLPSSPILHHAPCRCNCLHLDLRLASTRLVLVVHNNFVSRIAPDRKKACYDWLLWSELRLTLLQVKGKACTNAYIHLQIMPLSVQLDKVCYRPSVVTASAWTVHSIACKLPQWEL